MARHGYAEFVVQQAEGLQGGEGLVAFGVLWEESAQSKVVMKGLGCDRTMNR